MRWWPSYLFFMALVLAPAPELSVSADSNSCISCHTDDARMKSLVKPPEIGGEAEG